MSNEVSEPRPISAYECNVSGTDWRTVVNARTAGQAKAVYWRDVHESWESVPFTAVRVRCLGAPQDTARLLHVANYRGVNFRAGDRVNCGGALGYIVDGDSGACFTVIFDEESAYKGGRLVVHPSDIKPIQESRS